MKIESLTIENYKSFGTPTPILLAPQFNVVVGRNNVGKTALLEALSLSFSAKPHSTLTTKSAAWSIVNPDSRVRLLVVGTPTDATRALETFRGQLAIPSLRQQGGSEGNSRVLLNQLLSAPSFELTVSSTNGANLTGTLEEPFLCQPFNTRCALFEISDGKPIDPMRLRYLGDNTVHIRLETMLANSFRSEIYGFRSERLNIGKSPFGTQAKLSSDARNLPEAVNLLQSKNPDLFQELLRLVRRVFPTIQYLSAVPVEGDEVEIRVWEHSTTTRREDLAVPLSEGGTGLGQALAMLYVLVTATTERVLIIDEPNSFLHPGAIRELLAIFREYNQNQYIISTHSPQVVAALPDDTRVLVVSKGADSETKVTCVDGANASDARLVLDSVGARLSDVFGVDSVLWVEGPTEEKCFELLRNRALGRLRSEVLIRGVVSTADFNKRAAKLTLDIYQRLSRSSPLIPTAVGFIFDRERLADEKCDEIERESGGVVSFIPARMYECYLLDAEAIAARLLERGEQSVDEAAVAALLSRKLAEPKNKPGILDLGKVDAASLLQELFPEATDNRREFNKVDDGLAMTRWLLEHKRAALEPLLSILEQKLRTPPAT